MVVELGGSHSLTESALINLTYSLTKYDDLCITDSVTLVMQVIRNVFLISNVFKNFHNILRYT